MELHRLLRPDGLLLATFLGDGIWPQGYAGRKGVPYDERIGMYAEAPWRGFVDAHGPAVWHSEWWLREHWGRLFEIVDLETRGFNPLPEVHGGQGCVLMRPREVELTPEDLEHPADDPRELPAALQAAELLRREFREQMHHTLAERDRARGERDEAADTLRAVRSSRVMRMSEPARRGWYRLRGPLGMPEAAGLAYRAAGPDDGPPALLLHGYPESSYMWRDLLPALGDAGRRALAPDFAGFGDSQPDPPGTWERHIEAVERFRAELGLERVLLVVHDWGGLIGLRWACEHPDAVEALVISCTGFFPDGKWHGLAEGMRTPGTGEELMDGMTRDGFAAVMRESAAGIGDDAMDEYWKGFADEARRRGQLELYRSGDFEKLAPTRAGWPSSACPR